MPFVHACEGWLARNTKMHFYNTNKGNTSYLIPLIVQRIKRAANLFAPQKEKVLMEEGRIYFDNFSSSGFPEEWKIIQAVFYEQAV